MYCAVDAGMHGPAGEQVIDKFKKMRKGISGVATIVNTLDAYRYLGAATLSIQNAFGIQYVKDFLGAKVMILSSEIPICLKVITKLAIAKLKSFSFV